MAEVTPLTLDDYDAIADAVQETERGRWFLAEYARRNRAADTAAVLDALAGLEHRLSLQAPTPQRVVVLVHEALEYAHLARAAAPGEASGRFDELERTLKLAAEALGAPAPEQLVVVSIDEPLIEAPTAVAPVQLALAAPVIVQAETIITPHPEDDLQETEDEPIAAPSIAYEELEDETEAARATGGSLALEPSWTIRVSGAPTDPAPPAPSFSPRSSLLLDSLSAAEKAILFA